MKRISVVGTSGAGKSTFARALSSALGYPYVELDSIYHQPDWTALPTDEFRARVRSAIEGDQWVADGNYTKARDLVWGAADTVVWVDTPRRVVLRRVLARSLRRAWTREELWAGNREHWYRLLSPIPDHNIVLWSMTTFGKNRRRYTAAMQDERWRAVKFVRLTSPSEVDGWLASVARPGWVSPSARGNNE